MECDTATPARLMWMSYRMRDCGSDPNTQSFGNLEIYCAPASRRIPVEGERDEPIQPMEGFSSDTQGDVGDSDAKAEVESTVSEQHLAASLKKVISEWR